MLVITTVMVVKAGVLVIIMLVKAVMFFVTANNLDVCTPPQRTDCIKVTCLLKENIRVFNLGYSVVSYRI